MLWYTVYSLGAAVISHTKLRINNTKRPWLSGATVQFLYIHIGSSYIYTYICI